MKHIKKLGEWVYKKVDTTKYWWVKSYSADIPDKAKSLYVGLSLSNTVSFQLKDTSSNCHYIQNYITFYYMHNISMGQIKSLTEIMETKYYKGGLLSEFIPEIGTIILDTDDLMRIFNKEGTSYDT